MTFSGLIATYNKQFILSPAPFSMETRDQHWRRTLSLKMGRDQTHSLEEGGVEVQGLEGQGAEVEGEGGVVGEVPEAEVGSSEDLAGKVSSLGGGKDQWWF